MRCQRCDKFFEPKSSLAKFCSDSCRQGYHRHSVIRGTPEWREKMAANGRLAWAHNREEGWKPVTRSASYHKADAPKAGQLEEDWRVQAVCRGKDPAIWYPEEQKDAWRGVALCHTCPVEKACKKYAMAHQEEWGTWGGMTEWARDDRIRRSRHYPKDENGERLPIGGWGQEIDSALRHV